MLQAAKFEGGRFGTIVLNSVHFDQIRYVSTTFWKNGRFRYEISNSINATSKLLQNEKLDIIESTKALKAIDDYFVKIRTDDHFREILVDAAELAEELEIEAVFTNDIRARPRKKN